MCGQRMGRCSKLLDPQMTTGKRQSGQSFEVQSRKSCAVNGPGWTCSSSIVDAAIRETSDGWRQGHEMISSLFSFLFLVGVGVGVDKPASNVNLGRAGKRRKWRDGESALRHYHPQSMAVE